MTVTRPDRSDFTNRDLAAIEATTREVGHYLFDHLIRRQPNIFERRWWDDRIMSWAMQDDSVKVQMFRFVDVLPMLRTSEAVTGHLQEYFQEVRRYLPSAMRLGLGVARRGSLAGRALAITARRNVLGHARRFIAGTTVEKVLATALRQRKLRRAFTIDRLGEAVTSEREADRYLQSYIELIEGIAPAVNAWPDEPQIDRGVEDELPRVNVSIKLSALDSRFDAIDPVGSAKRVGERLRQLLRVASRNRAFVNVDMESYHHKDLTLAVFKQILMEDEFRASGDVGIVIQAYLKDAEADLIALRDWARERGKPIWVRLVKGAYWDYETIVARSTGWPVPVYEQKWETDSTFERLTRFLLSNYHHVRPAIASHNIRSLAHAIATARHVGLPLNGFELQMLYGMGDTEKQALVELGHRVRIYMPYGELIPGMAYLVRRLLENTSNDSFLRASFTEQISREELMMNPLDAGERDREAVAGNRTSSGSVSASTDALQEFENEPPADFAVAANRKAMQAALEHVREKFGAHEPLVIGAKEIETSSRMQSICPSHRRQVVGTFAAAELAHVEQAVAAAKDALPQWSSSGAESRARLLGAVAQTMRDRRFELAAWITHECGKPWREADGDVAEAIDFCEYYALGALLMAEPGRVDVPGEENRLEFLPRGVAAVIAPWNFPLAILTGMTAAALATGNTVVMKPAEQSSLVAARLMEIFTDCGAASGVVNYLPGRGETVGAALVEHPDVALVAFTGSRDVGLAIHRRAAETSGPAAGGVKRVIAEMGGKNAIIVDDDADLDEAVLGVAQSAFGYAGQKCSACSRAVVLASVYDQFLERLIEAVRSLGVGPAEEPGTVVGPVIDEEALGRIEGYIETGRSEGREVLTHDVGELSQEGFFVGPHIFADVAPDARIAQEEIFGPVLAVIRAGDFDEALNITNGTKYALTAGIFSRSPAHIDRARREVMVGNLYINRPITGALVCRQPFGGFRLSGIGSKAGGPDYLLQFVVPRTVTENSMRRGFAPTTS